jgi:hypothetical protein
VSQQYTSPQTNERAATGDTYEMSRKQDPNSTPRGSQASALDAEPTAANERVVGRSATAQTGNGSLLRDPENLRQRWESVQVGFVDNPREAVGEAENLVSSAIGEIANQFRQQRERLETSWNQGRDPSTDDLRVVFQSYRDFFGRLLQV